MAAGFRVRRVKTEQSIGDKLKRARTRKKITVAAVEEATKIRAKFILALESDSWEQIPSEVYGRGYLDTYLQFLQLPDREIVMSQFDRERSMYARHCQDLHVELSPKSRLHIPRFLLTPRFFVVTVAVMVLLLVGGGVGYQMMKFIAAPSLRVFTPVQAQESGGSELVVNARSVTIAGQTTAGSLIEVNGKPIVVEDDGAFTQVVTLQPGVNAIVVEADNGKKKTTEVLTVVVKE